jgi:hypothetical protein
MYNHSMGARRYPALLLSVALTGVVAAGCQSREVEKVLKVTNVETGWHDVGIVDGQNKLVPSVKFKLQNVTDEPIESVQVNAVFRQVTEDLAWGDRLIRGVGPDGLAGGATGGTLIVRSPRGYTGLQPRAEMLKNKDFVDVKVDLFARHGSRTWAKIGEIPIERKLLRE